MSNHLELGSSIFIECHRTDGHKVSLHKDFEKILEELCALKLIDIKYYHVLFTIFDNFVTPANENEYEENKSILREDAKEQVLKRFRCDESQLNEHENFFELIEKLLNFHYEKLKSFRGYFLEYIIYNHSTPLLLNSDPTVTNVHKYVEPEIYISQDCDDRKNLYGQFDNNIDVGIVSVQKSNQTVTDFILIECKSALDPFTKNLVYHLTGRSTNNPEFNKASMMKHIHQHYRSHFNHLILYFATYQTLADIHFKNNIMHEEAHYLIQFLQKEVQIIDFHKLIELVAV